MKLYLRYHFIKNALPVSHLQQKFQRNYTKKIYPIINYTKINQPLMYII